jgi:hypothetical protein
MKLTNGRKARLIVFKLCEYAEVGGMTPSDCGLVYEALANCLDDISIKEGDESTVGGLLDQIQQILNAEDWLQSTEHGHSARTPKSRRTVMNFDEAAQLYSEWASKNSGFPNQPSRSSSREVEGTWHLANNNGPLAIVTQDGRVIPPDEAGQGTNSPATEEEEKTAEITLPYYKQGDDLRHYLDSCNSIEDALENHAEDMDDAAQQLRKIKALVSGHDVEIEAGTHLIWISGPASVIDKLVENELAEEKFFEEDEDDTFQNDDLGEDGVSGR